MAQSRPVDQATALLHIFSEPNAEVCGIQAKNREIFADGHRFSAIPGHAKPINMILMFA